MTVIEMSYVYDIAIIAVFVLCVIIGSKKGIAKTIISFMVHVLCIIIAFAFSMLTAESMYMSYVQESVLMKVEEAVTNFNVSEEIKQYYSEKTVGLDISDSDVKNILSDTDNMDKKLEDSLDDNVSGYNADESYDALYGIINNNLQEKVSKYMPPCAGKYFDGIKASKKDVFTLINLLDTDKKAAAEYIEANCLRALMIKFVKIVSFVISSMVFMIIAKIIMSIINRNQVVKAAGSTDAMLGALLGAVIALVIMIMIAFLLKMIIYAGGQNDYLNEDVINDSLIFKYFYKIDGFMIK